MGLDADIWFTTPPRKKRGKDGGFGNLVSPGEKVNKSVFSGRHVALLRIALCELFRYRSLHVEHVRDGHGQADRPSRIS